MKKESRSFGGAPRRYPTGRLSKCCKRTEANQDTPQEAAGLIKSHRFTPHSVPESELLSKQCQSECHWLGNHKGGPVIELRATIGLWPFETAPLAGSQPQETFALGRLLGPDHMQGCCTLGSCCTWLGSYEVYAKTA